MIRLLKTVLRFRKEDDYDMMLLCAGQPILQGWAAELHAGGALSQPNILPDQCCVQLAFSGPKSSGKTVATHGTVKIAGGEMIVGTSPAALVRILGETSRKALGIDEVDARIRRSEDVEAILRAGSRWHAYHVINIPEGKGWKPVKIDVGGVKIFNYNSQIDDALMSRCYIIDSPQVRGDVPLVIANLFADPIFAEINRLIEDEVGNALTEAIVAHADWTPEKVEALMKSAEFQEPLRSLGKDALGRTIAIGAVLSAVATILGWPTDVVVRALSAQSYEDALEPTRELVRTIYFEWVEAKKPADGSELVVELLELTGAVNQRRRDLGLPWLDSKEWKRIRRELGWVEEVNEKKDSGRHGRRIVIFDATVRNHLGLKEEHAH